MHVILFYIFNPMLNTVAQLLLKLGALRRGEEGTMRMYMNPYVLTGYLFLLISMGWAIVILRTIDLKDITFVVVLNYIYTSVFSVLLLKEKLLRSSFFGIILIIIGVISYAYGNYN